MPAAVLALVLTERDELPDPLTAVGLKLAVAPVGSPLAANVTEPAKPLNALTLVV